jgi:hypothetical protein
MVRFFCIIIYIIKQRDNQGEEAGVMRPYGLGDDNAFRRRER